MDVPISFEPRDDMSGHYPQNYFRSDVSVGDDPLKNLQYAESQLTPTLGVGIEDKSSSNVLRKKWIEEGIGCLTLTIWPLGHGNADNPTLEKYPFLKTSCTVTLELFYVLPMTEQEDEWVNSFQALHHSSDVKPPSLRLKNQNLTEFLRKIDALPSGGIGMSADGKALIVSLEKDYCYVIPKNRIQGVLLDCIRGDRGEGDSFDLSVCIPKDFETTKPDTFNKITIASQYKNSNEIKLIQKSIESLL